MYQTEKIKIHLKLNQPLSTNLIVSQETILFCPIQILNWALIDQMQRGMDYGMLPLENGNSLLSLLNLMEMIVA